MVPDVFSPSEVVSLILCLLVILYVFFNMDKLRSSRYTMFIMALYCFGGAMLMTNIEEIILPELLNVIEHALMATSAFLVAFGCHEVLLSQKGPEDAP
jgi:hypothetical protein